jgi:hypothetical protein
MHLVHWNTGYGNSTVAMTKRDGLAVIGLLFQVDQRGAKKQGVRILTLELFEETFKKIFLTKRPI